MEIWLTDAVVVDTGFVVDSLVGDALVVTMVLLVAATLLLMEADTTVGLVSVERLTVVLMGARVLVVMVVVVVVVSLAMVLVVAMVLLVVATSKCQNTIFYNVFNWVKL